MTTNNHWYGGLPQHNRQGDRGHLGGRYRVSPLRGQLVSLTHHMDNQLPDCFGNGNGDQDLESVA